MLRTDELRCTQCAHRVLANPASCNCYCHATGFTMVSGRPVHAVPVPSSFPGDGGGGRNPVVPARHTTIPSAAGRDRTYPASSWGWWLAAAVSLMVVGFGALHGWHTTPVDTVAAIVVPLSLILGGVFWPERKGGE